MIESGHFPLLGGFLGLTISYGEFVAKLGEMHKSLDRFVDSTREYQRTQLYVIIGIGTTALMLFGLFYIL